MNLTNAHAPKAADADLLGGATPMKRPEPTEGSDTPTDAAAQGEGENFQQPRPAEDENQPGFIGERNLPHP